MCALVTNAPVTDRPGSAPRLRGGRPDDVAPTARTACRRVHCGRLGRPGRRSFIGSARGARHGRLRGLPGGVHHSARPRTAAPGRAVLRWSPRHRVLPPPPRNPPIADPGVGLRRMGRLVTCRRRRPAASTSTHAGRTVTRRIRQCPAADDVLPRNPPGNGRCVRGEHAGVPSSRASEPWPAPPPRI